MSTRHVHALRIVAAIEDQQRAVIATDPIAGIESLGYTVVAEPALTSKRGAGGWCDGMSFAEHNTVMYAPTPGSKKENFTLLHEVGHILVEQDDDALIWIADRDNPDVELERLCEEIAAALVVPEDLLKEVVGTGPLTGEDLKTLVARSAASGPACAIALSSRLSSGAVVIIDRVEAHVIHSALRGEELTVYPWKDNEVPPGHPLLSLEPGSGTTSKSYWTDKWGRRQEYYLSAVATEKRIYAILSISDLWGVDRFHGGQAPPEKSNAPRRTVRCACGYSGMAAGWPCETCGHQYCPKCGDCDCARRARAQQPCSVCFCNAPPVDLKDGVCSNCR
jgi:Zn-dependent peptidase ImmA (M78 family)